MRSLLKKPIGSSGRPNRRQTTLGGWILTPVMTRRIPTAVGEEPVWGCEVADCPFEVQQAEKPRECPKHPLAEIVRRDQQGNKQ